MSQDLIDAVELTRPTQHCQVAPDALHPKKFTVSILERWVIINDRNDVIFDLPERSLEIRDQLD